MPKYRFEFVGEPGHPIAIESDLTNDGAARMQAYRAIAHANSSGVLARHPNPKSLAVKVYNEAGELIATVMPTIPE